MRAAQCLFLALAIAVAPTCVRAQAAQGGDAADMDRDLDHDLLEIGIPRLEQFYAAHRYTVTQVVQWYIARIHRYNGIYRDIQTLDERNALATAARLDAEAAANPSLERGPMWGVPIVTKANTSVKGLVTTDGWIGYKLPGHELVAPRDATIVERLRAAGAIILGQTNMPDFAASDTNRSTAFGRTGNAYDVRFSPGGSSGGTVTAVTSNEAVLGNGTDTGNSIRMPSATSSVVGVFPTRGLVSIAGIAPLDWLLDNTGPIARDVPSAAIALTVMAGAGGGAPTPDAADRRTLEAKDKAQPGPYTQYLKADVLKGKRFGVPAFVLAGAGVPFQGVCPEPAQLFAADRAAAAIPLRPETRAAFLKALDGLRAAGATVVIADDLLPDSFADSASHICTLPYIKEGTENFLARYGPAQYRSAEQYAAAVGSPLPDVILRGMAPEMYARTGHPPIAQATLETDPNAEANYYGPLKQTLALYDETLDRLHLDGFVYPAIQMPPVDETMTQLGDPPNTLSTGPHSDTSWVNMLGVPAIVLPAGFYPSGLPFGLEISARRWHDGDLLGYGYAFAQAFHGRRPPVLVESGLLRNESNDAN